MADFVGDDPDRYICLEPQAIASPVTVAPGKSWTISMTVGARPKTDLLGPLAPSAVACERQYLWPEGRMPHPSGSQVAEKMEEVAAPGFDRAAHARPYVDWYRPTAEKANGVCLMTVSGGGFWHLADRERLRPMIDRFVAAGYTVADVNYRTPRPEGLPIHQSAWEDLQRAVRVVRSEAAKRGVSPGKIGATGISAGAKAVLLVATSSETRAYEPTDAIDELPCSLAFAIPQASAYVLTDGATGVNVREGEGADIVPELAFDKATCPMCLFHGEVDGISPLGATAIYRRLRQMKIPAEIHLFADRWHGFHGDSNRGDDGTAYDHWCGMALAFLRQLNLDGKLGTEEDVEKRFPEEDSVAATDQMPLWPEGKTPSVQTNQCTPYLELHQPARLSTKAVQVVFSGGGYGWNDPDCFEVAPLRRYLNARGMTVVSLKYRMPRPLGLPKHLTAWQDLQRAIRLVRSQAPVRGLDPERIGVMGGSASGHLALLGATSSRSRAYRPVDAVDAVPCTVQWAVALYPAYALTDGVDEKNTTGGNDDSARLVPEFAFDPDTCPVAFFHGDADGWAAMNSVKCWEQLRRMGVQGDLHTYVTRGHCFHRQAASGTGSHDWMDRVWEFMNHKGFNR